MEHSDLLRMVVDTFERLDIDYFVTGSVAAMYYGEPRFTNDIDVVARLQLHHVTAFCQAFRSEDFYLNEDAVRSAIANHSQFNIIAAAFGLKIDVIVSRDDAFDQSRFLRRVRVRPDQAYNAQFASAEDVIVKKMAYYHEGQSEKHIRDITAILTLRKAEIDDAYIRQWAERLGLEEVWELILSRLGPAK